MSVERWLKKNTQTLVGKTVAITGSTGGLGQAVCSHLASLGASLVLVDRNAERSHRHKERLVAQYAADVRCIQVELEDAGSVNAAADKLAQMDIDVLVLNAGAYSIPRHRCTSGYDNIFQINYISQYTLAHRLLPHLRERRGKVVAVGSIAHRYSKADANDVDFSTRKGSALAYGNSKRYLTYALYELFRLENEATLSIVHPGITPTNITAHYPKIIYAVIKHPMKLIFMKTKKASLSVLHGIQTPCGYGEWIGPWAFDVWGYPRKKRLRSISEEERRLIADTAEKIGKGDLTL